MEQVLSGVQYHTDRYRVSDKNHTHIFLIRKTETRVRENKETYNSKLTAAKQKGLLIHGTQYTFPLVPGASTVRSLETTVTVAEICPPNHLIFFQDS